MWILLAHIVQFLDSVVMHKVYSQAISSRSPIIYLIKNNILMRWVYNKYNTTVPDQFGLKRIENVDGLIVLMWPEWLSIYLYKQSYIRSLSTVPWMNMVVVLMVPATHVTNVARNWERKVASNQQKIWTISSKKLGSKVCLKSSKELNKNVGKKGTRN